MNRQRVLIVDDSPFIRRMISDWIRMESDLEVVGVAANADEAIALALAAQPDVVSLDVEMPGMSGLQALPSILAACPRVLMVSSLTTRGASQTISALEAGAYDFVAKPSGSNSLAFLQCRAELLDKLRAARYVQVRRPVESERPEQSMPTSSDRVVVIASSTGGPGALKTLWQGLPKGFPAPIVVVQHLPKGFSTSFARRLDDLGTVACLQAEDRARLRPGFAYIAPDGFHATIDAAFRIRLVEGPSVNGVCPAADALFESAAQWLGNRTIGLVLSGMGRDGAAGAAKIRQVGGLVYGQNEDTCVIYGMPKAARLAGGIDAEYPLGYLAGALCSAVAGGNRVVA